MQVTLDIEVVSPGGGLRDWAVIPNVFEQGKFWTKFLYTDDGSPVFTTAQRVETPFESVLNVTAAPNATTQPDPRLSIFNTSLGGSGQTNILACRFSYTDNAAFPANWLLWRSEIGIDAISSVFRGVADLVWTCDRGIVSLPHTHLPPYTSAELQKSPIGLTSVAPSGHTLSEVYGLAPFAGTEYLVTFDGDKNIYVWDSANSGNWRTLDPNTVDDGTYPRLIQRSADGASWYVLTYRAGMPVSGSARVSVPGGAGHRSAYAASEYELMRFVSNGTGGLKRIDTIVKSY